MDELLHHCLRELSFDGDLGCNVSRLRDFIVGFYAHNGTHQTPDDAFCAFVWSLVVQQPTIRVGTVPPGVSSEVWVAPQTSAKRKAIAKGEEHVETKPPELDIIPDAQPRTLDELNQEYGDRLRIAVHPDAIYAAVTGSHIRFAKMSPMVYSALQIITKGRDDGITVVELGQQSRYDQKTCFYLVRQLTDLDLVVKVRRGGVGTHFVIHKYFFDRSPSWKAIREEENRAQGPHQTPSISVPELPEEEDGEPDIQSLDFTPIDARHLSSLPLVRGRVVKLLKASRNHMHASQNMLITLGFSNPTKTDRRFFQSRIREMIQQGVIEKVVVPSSKKKSGNATVKCFRLVAGEQNEKLDAEVIAQSQGGEEEDKETGDLSGVKMNITIHKQVFDLLEESGTIGMTLNELSAALCQFDKRTIELLLARAEKFLPPPHLSDLGIAGLMETRGRERRHRYFTIAAYHELITKENLDNSSTAYPDVDFTEVGGFMPLSHDLFYEDDNTLFKYQDSFKDTEKMQTNTRKRPFKNPILADGSVKQGRPRKYPVGEDPKSLRKKGVKRKHPESVDDGGNLPIANSGKEERPKKRRKEKNQETGVQPKVPKKRGRPPKEKSNDASPDEASLPSRPRKRGRTSSSNQAAVDDLQVSDGKRAMEVPQEQRLVTNEQSTQAGEAVDSEDRDKAQLPTAPHELFSITPEAPLALLSAELPSPADVTTLSDIPSPSKTHVADDAISAPPEDSSDRDSSLLFSTPTTDDVPIDPALRLNVILEAHEIVPMGSPLTPLSEQVHEITPQDALPIMETIATDAPLLGSAAEGITDESFKKNRETRVNVSHLRRENELYRVVQNMGGIVNIQTKDFYDGHMSLIEAMAKAGEPTSGPVGTRTDKRTAVATFDTLERRGRIKQLKTSVVTHTGVRRPACIVYFPTIGQDKLNTFLADLARSSVVPHPGNFVKLDQHVEYGADPTSVARGALPLQLLQMEEPGEDRKERWSKNMARAKQLFTYEDPVVREVLLTERTTVAQSYGFIVGKAVRAREIHLSTLDAFEKGNSSSAIISHEHRIIDLSFFGHDIPLGLYCSLVSSLTHSEELTQFMGTESGRMTLIKDLPASLNFMLQIGRSRARSRFLDLLETLRALKLVTPLQASTSDTPFVACTPVDGYPGAFDLASLDGWTVSTPMAAPTYWLFNDMAPIHVWAASEVSPPFWQDVRLTSTTDAVTFWRLLEQASLSTHGIVPSDSLTATGPPTTGISVARSLRRQVSWNPNYVLTWHQMQYMKQFIDPSTATTPLQDEDQGATRLERISWVISAPQASVASFFQATREKFLKDIEKLRKKSERSLSDKKTKRSASTKASLARKAAEAQSQREENWKTLILRLHPAPLEGAVAVRVNRVHDRFLQANSVKRIEKWEAEVAHAIQEADSTASKVLKTSSKRTFASRPVPVPLDALTSTAANPSEKSVELLIAMQGPPIIQQEKVKRKRKKDTREEMAPIPKAKTLRRHRFQWNRDYEELARDASVIIKARCRNLPRLDWAAFEQVFPAVPRNTVRQRLAHIRETPGNEAYLSRLEDRWYELWMQHRGTPALPDDDPTSMSNFNLIKHIEFLRQHIDKNAIRVGFAQPKEKAHNIIPSSVDELLDHYQVLENTATTPAWDFVWNAVVEEGREKRMLRQPFLNLIDDLSFGPVPPDHISLAESAVKMTLGTPHERYEPEAGAALLHSIGEHYVSPATKNLLNRGVLSKLVRDPQKQKPGRQLKISEGNQNAIGGPIPRDTFQDAVALEDLSLQDGTWREWPLLASDGDSAAVIQLVSEDKLAFIIDTSPAQLARTALDWNSKKADDDQIETVIRVRTVPESTPSLPLSDENTQTPPYSPTLGPLPSISSSDEPVNIVSNHGKCFDGDAAACRRSSNVSLVDCTGCLEEEWISFNDFLTPQERDRAKEVLEIVRSGGAQGVSKGQVLNTASTMAQDRECVLSIVKKMMESSIPMLFWTGYSSAILVSSAFLKHWTIMVSQTPVVRIFPRRWIDVMGVKVKDFWESAIKAVVGVVVFRPGVTQAELRWRLRSIYDRQEICDIVRWLADEGYLKMRCEPSNTKEVNVRALDDQEERGAFWFMGEEKHWYQV